MMRILSCTLLAAMAACTDPGANLPSNTPAPAPVSRTFQQSDPGDAFKKYWYAGEAELNVFEVAQERYGAIREAQQVMIFVTEDFSAKKQVKLDFPEQAGPDKVPVLKLNTVRKFQTGIYDYSLMNSVFTPVYPEKYPQTLKSTTSIQDWCGHVFSQINLNENNEYRVRELSYFEAEGDKDFTAEADMLEDEFWVRIRLDPAGIPEGKFRLLPSQFFTRLKHVETKPYLANIRKVAGKTSHELHIDYIDLPRRLLIRYEAQFPYRIDSWEETSHTGQILSKGNRISCTHAAYWAQNMPDDQPLRDSIGFRFNR